MTNKLMVSFRREFATARVHFRAGEFDAAFYRLERAHILGQRFFVPHMRTHWWMLQVGMIRGDIKEIVGQLFRLLAVIPGYLFGWVPIGNTGGADVSAIRPMPIPEDLSPRLAHFNIRSAVAERLRAWILIGLLLVLALSH